MTWYVVQIAPRSEPIALFFIKALGFAPEYPTVLTQVRQRSRQPWRNGLRRAPMFPGYVFVSFDTDDVAWRQIPTQPGVLRILGQSPESPTPLPTGTVEAILARDSGLVVPDDAPPGIAPGQRARVIIGSWVNKDGICCKSSLERVTLLLEFMGMPRPVEFPVEAVEAIE